MTRYKLNCGAQFKHSTTIIWDDENTSAGEVWGLLQTSALWRTGCHLSVFCFSATVEINCYLWLSQPRLVKYWRTKRDWLSEVERLGQSRLIRQTKCYFCFLCGWGVKEGGWGGVAACSLITSAISVVSANPPPLLRHFSLCGWFKLNSLFSSQYTTPTFTTFPHELSYTQTCKK